MINKERKKIYNKRHVHTPKKKITKKAENNLANFYSEVNSRICYFNGSSIRHDCFCLRNEILVYRLRKIAVIFCHGGMHLDNPRHNKVIRGIDYYC